MQRDPAIDILKGIGIIMVVASHQLDLHPATVLYDAICSVHMPLFFLVAGYFLRPEHDLRHCLAKDFRRLVIPYLAVMPLLAAYTFAVHCMLRHDCQALRTLPETVFFNSTPVWFLLALFWARQACNLALTRTRQAIPVLLLLSLAVTFSGGGLHTGSFLSIRQGLSAILFVVIGHIARKCSDRMARPKPVALLIALTVWGLAIAYAEVSMVGCHYRLFPLAVAGACCGTYVLLALSRTLVYSSPGGGITRLLTWCGEGSMVVLCAHTVERYVGAWRFLGVDSPWVIIPAQLVMYAAALWLVRRSRPLSRVFGVRPSNPKAGS